MGARIVSVVGTRPEAIKMAPVERELAARASFQQTIILTGQHQGLAAMLGGDGRDRVALDFDPRGRTDEEICERLHELLAAHLRRNGADLLLVQGDTHSAVAGARAAEECGIALGHVEAGLRSFDLAQPWPEEGNRIEIDRLAQLLFAPTERAAANLTSDAFVGGEIHVTGNTGIDALFHAKATLDADEAGRSDDRRLILATCHRRENRGAPLKAICAALERIVDSLPVRIVLPLHLNRHVKGEVEALLAAKPHIELRDPLCHREMVELMSRSWAILTDSGGLQEEGPALGKPVLVTRNVTERPEALESDNIELIGNDPERIVSAVSSLLADEAKYRRMSRPCFAFGDGRAAPRIVDAIEAWLGCGVPIAASA